MYQQLGEHRLAVTTIASGATTSNHDVSTNEKGYVRLASPTFTGRVLPNGREIPAEKPCRSVRFLTSTSFTSGASLKPAPRPSGRGQDLVPFTASLASRRSRDLSSNAGGPHQRACTRGGASCHVPASRAPTDGHGRTVQNPGWRHRSWP